MLGVMDSPGVTILLTGDVMTGRGIDQILGHPSDPRLYESWAQSAIDYVGLAEASSGSIPRPVDDTYIWGEALTHMQRTDIAARIINLETAVTTHDDAWPGKGINYRMHPANVGVLKAADVDCCVLANNHVLDWSRPGLEQTIATLRGAGLSVAGAGTDDIAAWRPVVIERASGSRIVVVATGSTSSGIPRSWAARSDRPGVALLSTLSAEDFDIVPDEPGDILIFSIHWGRNWGYGIPDGHHRFARELIDMGMHIVHGHSSHHPLGIEVYRNRPILYGCGDLINDYEGIPGHEEFGPGLSLLYLVTIDPGTGWLERLELIPLRMHRFRLEAASEYERKWVGATLNREGRRLGTWVEESEEGHLLVRW